MWSIFSLSLYSTHLQGNVSQLEKSLVSPHLHLPSLQPHAPLPNDTLRWGELDHSPEVIPAAPSSGQLRRQRRDWGGSGFLPDPSIRGSLRRWGLQPSHMCRDCHQLGGVTPPWKLSTTSELQLMLTQLTQHADYIPPSSYPAPEPQSAWPQLPSCNNQIDRAKNTASCRCNPCIGKQFDLGRFFAVCFPITLTGTEIKALFNPWLPGETQ